MRASLILAGLLCCAAAPASYDATCPATCTASDGTAQPAGTVLYRFMWDGASDYVPRDLAGQPLTAVPDPGQQVPVYVPQTGN